VDQDESATSLALVGQASSRAMSATITDGDSGSGLGGVSVEFFIDGRSIGTATTDAGGTATASLPAKYRFGPHAYEAVFSGNAYYDRSAAKQQT
jgi:hypothetical protein